MAKVKVGMSTMDVPMKLEHAEKIANSITGNASFVEPYPTVAAVTESIGLLRNAYQESLGGSSISIAAVALREKELDFMMNQWSAYVQNVSNGNPEIIRSSGFDIRNESKVVREVTQPQALKAIMSPYPGQAVLKWKAVEGKKSYFVEKSLDGSTNWIQCGTCTVPTIEIDGLPSTTYLWFRVFAIGSLGTSPASDAVKALIG